MNVTALRLSTFALALLVLSGCARPMLSPDEAAQLAARLANEQCERHYQKRPFTAGQHAAVIKDGRYYWGGGLDVGGPGGFSARVSFRRDGSDAMVEVYFSSDILKPQFDPPPESPLLPNRP